MYDDYLTRDDERTLEDATDRLIAQYDIWDGQMRELTPDHTEQKSFGGRAYVASLPGGDTLYSYCTRIIDYRDADRTVVRRWSGWSRTTAKHVDEYLLQHGARRGIGKAQWLAMPCNEPISIDALAD